MYLSPLSQNQDDRQPRRDGIPGLRAGLWLAGAIAVVAILFELSSAAFSRGCRRIGELVSATGGGTDAASQTNAAPAKPFLRFVNPTPQASFTDTNSPAIFMPTASGRQESALYGATRTDSGGPRWHEGIDIAPTKRDSRRRPQDDVFAVADGKVAYINAAPGNSSYGRYVILTHDDPMGWIYTLYAHLDSVSPELVAGREVKAGQVIGRLGFSSSVPGAINVERAHLHFEIGVFINTRYPDYMKERGAPLTHGAWDGRNLYGINPLAMLNNRDADGAFSMLAELRSERPALIVAVKVDPARPPEYFRHYPDLNDLGKGDAPKVADVALLEIAESGVPLRLRPWPDAEPAPAAKDLPKLFGIDEGVLGRNARGFATKKSGKWELTNSGKNFIAQIFYPAK